VEPIWASCTAINPDIVDFIEAKLGGDRLSNFNISVGVTDKFMRRCRKQSYDLINPRTGRRTREMKARSVSIGLRTPPGGRGTRD